MSKHPEGGYFSEVFRSNELHRKESLPSRYKGDRHHYSSIYFLLEKNNFSAFHKLKTDEIWHFYSGGRLLIYLIESKDKITKIKLGFDHKSGDKFQALVKKGKWFAAEVENKNSYSLVGCTLSPGFDFEDFELGDRNKLTKQFPIHKDIIDRLTR
jgi:hypothetical protein